MTFEIANHKELLAQGSIVNALNRKVWLSVGFQVGENDAVIFAEVFLHFFQALLGKQSKCLGVGLRNTMEVEKMGAPVSSRHRHREEGRVLIGGWRVGNQILLIGKNWAC